MFDELRKKISNAIKGLSKKEEVKAEIKAEENIGKPIEPNYEIGKPSDEGKAITQVTETKEHPSREAESQKAPETPKKPSKVLDVSLASKIKGAVLGNVSLNESEISGFVDKVKISLIESDVSYDVAEEISEDLHSNLRNMKVSPSLAEKEFLGRVREAMIDVLSKSANGIDVKAFIAERVAGNAIPVKILFLGPNGTGKTTTIAKIAYMLKDSGVSCVISASDTFRAAAIEQTEYHAKKVGVPVIKSSYGADPASVAFDAIAHAKSHRIEVVLIDSAGRQETNRNLVMEIQKLARVAKPDLTIFVGESTAGNALPSQIRELSNAVKINGIILTKLDCDAKGGNAISIARSTGIPILFFGTGEKYDALVRFDPNLLVDSILPAS